MSQSHYCARIYTLRALRQFASTARASAPFLGIGNPVLEGTPGRARGIKLANLFRGPLVNVDFVRTLTLLPETADELRAVAKAMGAGERDLYLADCASEPLLRQAGLDRYRVHSIFFRFLGVRRSSAWITVKLSAG